MGGVRCCRGLVCPGGVDFLPEEEGPGLGRASVRAGVSGSGRTLVAGRKSRFSALPGGGGRDIFDRDPGHVSGAGRGCRGALGKAACRKESPAARCLHLFGNARGFRRPRDRVSLDAIFTEDGDPIHLLFPLADGGACEH